MHSSPIPHRSHAIGQSRAPHLVVRARLRAAPQPGDICRAARDLAWQWVASKWPRLLPSASAMESHHYARSAPGQSLVASSEADGAWSLTVSFDERHGTRSWVTHVEVDHDGDATMLALQTACTALPDAPLVVAPPRLLGSWVEQLDLMDGPVAVVGTPRLVADAQQLSRFLEHVASPERHLPIIALGNRPGTRFYGVDPAGLATSVRGLAHVACLAPEVSDAVANRFGPHLGVVAGAARIYGAGVPLVASPHNHALVRNHFANASSAANASAFRRLLCQRVCALSVRQPQRPLSEGTMDARTDQSS